MRTPTVVTCLWFLTFFFIGCDGIQQVARPRTDLAGRELLGVDFQRDKVLRYKFVSSRQVEVDFGPGRGRGEDVVHTMSETMELVIAYEPLGVDSQGLTTVKAACESAKVKRTTFAPNSSRRRDAVETLKGKTFTLKVAASGMLVDKAELKKVIMELGEKAFAKSGRRIKDPDMIVDFITTQWFLWDSTSSIESPASGVAVGQSWTSRLPVPLPIPMRTERRVVYKLDKVRRTQTGRVAVIKSSYSPADSATVDWPMPYGGRFQMRGMFGFFQGYKILNLSGEGTELFNIDKGVVEQATQKYKVGIDAVIPFALGESNDEEPKPNITISQEITMQLVDKGIPAPETPGG